MIDLTTRADLEHLIEVFYGRVFADELIGPFFTEVAQVRPETHFPLLADFWETVLFARNRYHGNVIAPHVELHRQRPLEPAHFARWLALFEATVDELFAGPYTEEAKIRARTMAVVLQAKINFHSRPQP